MNGQASKNVTVTAGFLAARGYSITRAAMAVGVSPNHLSQVSRGLRKPSKGLVAAIMRLPQGSPIRPYRSYDKKLNTQNQ